MDVLENIADAYVKFLSGLAWDNPLVLQGAREGLNKFLSNAYLASFPGCRKHELTQLISQAALDHLATGRRNGLVFEHVVPKNILIQRPCEARARAGTLTRPFVLELLRKYWVLATITSEEDSSLAPFKMPVDWDGKNVFARYHASSIGLLPNPFMAPNVPTYDPMSGNLPRGCFA